MTILALLAALAAPSAPALADPTPRGSYVEARTATVFAGACHYAAQYTTQGREAVLAWRFDGGVLATDAGPAELDGVELVVALAGARNLDVAGSERRSVVWLEPATSPALETALVGWLRGRLGPALGETVAVERAPLSVAFDPERDGFRVAVGASVELSGRGLPERECCSMPYAVWYRPFDDVPSPIVGCVDVFRFADARLDRRWSRPDENSAFLGRFGEGR